MEARIAFLAGFVFCMYAEGLLIPNVVNAMNLRRLVKRDGGAKMSSGTVGNEGDEGEPR
ncbi:hypothetical protein K457DRAFT_132468 [Linnemannia elongata AG-77]|uniref:Uncharacterized protein n=1 Tax=Linnemannia elongata AG-77 TaxID=1314771 RepID=A0A197KDJ9_9FUNG|nr:hypothetical protein K457DRAFT_132468 [Linnemannia elongata AG-77]